MRYVLMALVRLYQILLGPFLGGRCRFLPSCSAYALDALRVHGAARGSGLTLRRLCRCHPVRWLGGGEGLDPVPPRCDSVSSSSLPSS